MKDTHVMVAVLVFGLSFSASAAEPGKAMTPEQQAMMQQMEKFSSPSDAHKQLEPMAGNFTFTTKAWMKPGDKPMEGKGTITNAWVYGGRFLKRDFKMECNGQTMEGTGYSGYDNVRGEYQDIWLGSMGTGVMVSAGTYDAASKTFKIAGTASDPMTGNKAKPFRGEVKIVSNDKHVFMMFDKGPDGKEFKMMEETYTRSK